MSVGGSSRSIFEVKLLMIVDDIVLLISLLLAYDGNPYRIQSSRQGSGSIIVVGSASLRLFQDVVVRIVITDGKELRVALTPRMCR